MPESNQESNQGRQWLPEVHFCPRCGRRTIFRLCDACFAVDVSQAATGPLPPLAQAMAPREVLRSIEDLSWLADIGEIGGARDGAEPDEFTRTVAAWRAAPEARPRIRFWSGMCWWCWREIREGRGDDEELQQPPLHLMRTCYRHRKGQLALLAWLRREKFGQSGKDGAA